MNHRYRVLCFVACLLSIGLLASSCYMPTPSPTATPTLTPTPTPIPPTPTPTATLTPIPSPTPVPAARVASGDGALFDGDIDAALLAYTSAGQNSQDAEIRSAALLGMGRAYFTVREHARALDALREAVTAYPASPHTPAAYFCLGQVYDALARYSEAAEAYQNYLARRPGVIDSYVFEYRGDALINAGNFSGALTDYQAALASPRSGSLFSLQVKVARAYAITGDYATALVMYNDIYTRAEDDYLKAQVDYLIGLAYSAIGQTDNANAAYLDAVNNYPLAYDSYLALINLVEAGYPVDELERGLVDYYAGQHLVAIAAFDRYLDANPGNPATAYYYKGLALSASYDYEGAIQQWDVVIQNYAASGLWDNAWEMKGYTQWYYLAKYPEAAQTLLDFVSASPYHPRAAEFLFDAGRVFERNKKLARAAKVWERAADEYPTSDYAYRALSQAGIARYRQEDYPGARDVFQRLMGISSDNSQKAAAYLWMGKSLQAQGDAAGAKANFEQAATSDPTGYYSVRASEILSQRTPFTPPEGFDLAVDGGAERSEAEAWLRATFSLPPGTDLASPGALWSDGRLTRGAELWSLGLYPEAREEFESLRLAVINDPADTYRLANYFVDIGLYRSAILAARQVLTLAGMDDAASLNAPAHFNHIRFGSYYASLVIPLGQAYHFHPLFLFSLVRQESFFESFIDSPAGARGLMQIMPATAQGIVDANGWPPNYTLTDLYRPKVSLTLGADYLADQRDYLENDLYAALAAYNGGPGNAMEWRELAGGDPDLFLEIVRFDETRRYIKGIVEMYNIYRMIYGRNP